MNHRNTHPQLEESADVLQRRVEALEAEVAAKPVVDVDAFAVLEEDLKTATAVGEGLRVHVSLGMPVYWRNSCCLSFSSP